MLSTVRGASACLLVCLAVRAAAPDGAALLAKIRDGDTAAVRRLIRSGAPANARDEFGSTALLYAALHADVAVVRELLQRGADPNMVDNAGTTPLMVAVRDEAMARLLIERGANVNAVASQTGRTPLMIAAARPGGSAVVKLLLDKGADPNVRDKRGASALIAAIVARDSETFRLLLDHGADPKPPSASGATPLSLAANYGNAGMVEALLARGVDAKSTTTVGIAEEILANEPLLRKLVDRGADLKTANTNGFNPLMSVVRRETADPALVRRLIDLGLDPDAGASNLHTKYGYGNAPETPLDWARRNGETPAARELAKFRSTPATAPAERALLRAATPRAAIEKALPLLYDGGREFFKRSGCTSCHHNTVPALVYSLSRAKGIVLDEPKVQLNSKQSVAWLKGKQQDIMQASPFPGGSITPGNLLWGLAEDGYRRDAATDAAVHHLTQSQGPDGEWRIQAYRPPIEASPVSATAAAVRALTAYPIPGRAAEIHDRVRRAGRWLAAYTPRSNEERAMRVLGMTWAAADSGQLRKAADDLLAQQRPDGGWAQLDTLESDSYATGEGLYALHVAGALPTAALNRGARFLLDTQLADGSWHVRSRSYPVQPNYFDTGFPHGRDQWISAAGTSWACAALTLAIGR